MSNEILLPWLMVATNHKFPVYECLGEIFKLTS